MAGETTVSWSELTGWRAECFARFGSVHRLPVVAIDVEIRRLLAGSSSVLDLGAGAAQPLRRMLPPGTNYFSLDTDPAGVFDYADISEIPADRRFDLVVANQVLEHIPIADSLDLVRRVREVLEPGGRFMATVPNPSHPVRHWGDATHVTHWPYDDLYGLFRVARLEVDQLARYGKRRMTRRPLRRLIVRAVAAEFRMDWCDSLLVVGRRAAAT